MNESSPVDKNEARPKRRRAWLWPGIVVGMLSVHTVGCLIVVFIATSDPSHAVVSDYHAKAIAWDQQRAQQRHDAALGWTTTIDVALAADMLGQRTVRVSIRDAEDKPLADAVTTLAVYHHARAKTIIEAQAKEAAPGEYIATMDMRRPGMWTLSVAVQRGEELFHYTTDQQVGAAQWSPR